MNSSSATPISLSGDSCASNESRCRIATPAPTTPYPYSPLTPYGSINPFSYMSRYSTPAGVPHMGLPFAGPLANSLVGGLSYPPDLFHYNPYSALTPTSPLTPSSFWSLTAQQSYHQLNGITFGPSGPISYNSNAHLFNLFSPNSLSPMSPSPDIHSPSLYPRVSLPSPYATSPGLSSAYMSPSSMPLLLSPSLSSSVDRPPTYLSDNTTNPSTPSTTPSITPSIIKCEPTDNVNYNSLKTSQTLNSNNITKNNIENNFDSDRHFNGLSDESYYKTSVKHNEHNHCNNNSKHNTKHPKKLMTTTITTATTTTKIKEKHSARVEPLIRLNDNIIDREAINGDSMDKQNDIYRTNDKTLLDVIDERKSQHRDDMNDDNNDKYKKSHKLVDSRVKSELISCDMSLPLISVKSVPNFNDNTSDFTIKHNNSEHNITTNKLSHKHRKSSDDNTDDNHLILSQKNLIEDINDGSIDINDVISSNDKTLTDNKKVAKDTKRESQLKQLQSYRKESHRLVAINGNQQNDNKDNQMIHQSNTAISIVKPKPKDRYPSGDTYKDIANTKSGNSHLSTSENQSLISSTVTTILTTESNVTAIPSISAIPRTQTVIPCGTTKLANKITPLNVSNNLSANNTKQNSKLVNGKRSTVSNHMTARVDNQNNVNNAVKQLPKKPRLSRKQSSATIPVGIAIAQQRTSPKTKSPTESVNNASQQLKPILPTLSLPVMANSPILITDSPPTGTSLWIKPSANSSLNNTNSTPIQTNSPFSFSSDYQLARDSITGHLYLIRNSSSLPTTPTTTPKPSIISPMNIKSADNSKSSPAIITVPVGPTPQQQFFASLSQTPTSTLILDTTQSAPLVQIAATAPVSTMMTNINNNMITSLANHKLKSTMNGNELSDNLVNIECGCQASISDEEFSCDNIKTTATQVDMDCIHSSEDDDDNDGKQFKLNLFNETKQNQSQVDTNESDDESSRDSIQLQIVDEMLATDEPPQLPVKSAPVMQFIDHHGLDLLVDSIEEFAARQETTTPNTDLPVNGLQLLSTLAEQRSREEMLSTDTGAMRRHSVDSSIISNGLNSNNDNPTKILVKPLKKRQRSESCFTSNSIRYNESDNSLADLKKVMKTSGSQTDVVNKRDTSFACFRKNENIFKKDSLVSTVKDVNNGCEDDNKDKNVLNSNQKFNKPKDNINLKSTSPINNINAYKVSNNERNVVSNGVDSIKANEKPHYVFVGTKTDHLNGNQNKFIDNSIHKTKNNDKHLNCDNNKQKTNNNNINDFKKCKFNDQQKIKKKKKKIPQILSTFNTSISSTSLMAINGNKKDKKRKKFLSKETQLKKKIKTDHNKQIDESIESIIRKVTQKDQIDSELEDKPSPKASKLIADNHKDSLNIEFKDENRKKKLISDPSFELYDEKRMKLLDETIDEVIAKHLQESNNELNGNDDIVVTENDEKVSQVMTSTTNDSKITEESLKTIETPKPKSFVKQISNCSIESSTSSSASSASDSSQSSLPLLNLKLSESDLDLKLNVIMLVDGLLFIGEICPIQPPDIYGIVLHGERQHRPIIYSQEDMLNEAIREVKPSIDDLTVGQRVCAFWSTQYRHLYPGYVRTSSPHPTLVFVEFDDGDNGRIPIEDIRLLPQDYPQMKINADPLKNLERKRRMSSCGKDSRHSKYINETIDNKKSNNESVVKSIFTKIKSNDEMKQKKDNLKMKSKNSSTNTVFNSLLLKRKKKKHNKDDRHHRHHHNHKHHHCRHHKKCKKHKKLKDTKAFNNNNNNDVYNINSETNNEHISSKSTKQMTHKFGNSAIKEIKDDQKANVLNAQKVESTGNEINKSDEYRPKIAFRSVIKKTAKERALNLLRTDLSEKMCTLLSPIRKRTNPNDTTNKTPNVNTDIITKPKKRERMPSSAEKSKIAAFLPDRQLWHWSGKYIKRTGNKGSRNRKIYYKSIERGREHIRIDDCAVFLSTGRPHLPYIGRIDSMWQTGSGTMIVKVRWFYHPEETKGDPVPLIDNRGALFESSHFDVNDVQTISHKCQVISWTELQERRLENPSLMVSDDPPNIYYLAGSYDALTGRIDMDTAVPVKDKHETKDDYKSEKIQKTTSIQLQKSNVENE